MALWKVQAGRHGEQESIALEHGMVAIGWHRLGDLSKMKSKEDLERYFYEVYPEAKPKAVVNQVGQIWAFVSRIQVKDWVAMPLKSRSAIAIGKVKSAYEYRKDLGDIMHHTRPVKWLRADLPRTAFDQDLLYSFGAFMTVCRIQRNDAENRVRAIVEGRKTTSRPEESAKTDAVEMADDAEVLDLEQTANDQIQQTIARKFRGHDLPPLVDAVLKAQGYVTRVFPPGPDGGVDILAGSGQMGFDAPRVCVQVKSSDAPVDVGVLRELRGTMESHEAEHGLLISWGGFKSSVLREAAAVYFKIRLWDQGELLRQILANYDRFPESLQAELPLKRIWALALEEETE